MKKIENLFLNGFVAIRHQDAFQYGLVGHSTGVVKRRFTDGMQSHYIKFDAQSDFGMFKPINPVALKSFLNDMKTVNISSEELIRLMLEQIG